MKYGATLSAIPLPDMGETRELAQAYDAAGFDYLGTWGHVLTARPDRYEGRPNVLYAQPYHEPFTLFAHLAAVTSRVHFLTSIAILPMLPTVMVAKQALELAYLSGDRFELGVGLSWQEAEYRALGQDFHTRGARLSEQAEVLKLLWSQPRVTYKGAFHDIDDLGLGRLPRRPIPLWFGTEFGERALRRAAAHGDGWIALADPTEVIPRLRGYLSEAGRDPKDFQIMFRLLAGDGGPQAWIAEAQRLRSIGVTHLTVAPDPQLAGEAAVRRAIEARTVLADALG